jgi:uncharacterized membrane protein
MMILLVVTWLVDLIWMIYWIPVWNSEEMKDWQKGLHNFVIFFTVINFLMKMAVIVMLGFTHREMLKKQVLTIQTNIKAGNLGFDKRPAQVLA